MRNETIFVFAFPRAPNQLAARARHPDPGAESLTPMPVKALSVALRKLFGNTGAARQHHWIALHCRMNEKVPVFLK